MIFDEFHERSLNADLGLALSLGGARRAARRSGAGGDVGDAGCGPRRGDAGRCPGGHLGRAAPFRWRPAGLTGRGARSSGSRPPRRIWSPRRRPRRDGGVLVFLPGEGEIRRVEASLSGRLPADCGFTRFTARWISPPSARRWPRRVGAKGGAGDLDRGNLADHSGHPGRGRLRAVRGGPALIPDRACPGW